MFQIEILKKLKAISWSHLATITVPFTHSISRSEVNSNSPSAGGQQEHENIGLVLEILDHVPPVADLGGPVETHVLVVPVPHVVLQKVDHLRHLRVDEDPVAGCLHAAQQRVEDVQFAGIHNHGVLAGHDDLTPVRY